MMLKSCNKILSNGKSLYRDGKNKMNSVIKKIDQLDTKMAKIKFDNI